MTISFVFEVFNQRTIKWIKDGWIEGGKLDEDKMPHIQ